MNNSEITESTDPAATDRVAESEKAIFGDVLLRAREAKSCTIIDAAKATHLSESIIDALEQSDLKRLPPPTFVQGYLRTYARFLGLPEQKTVDDFNRAVPYRRESVLQPRHSLLSQASSHSPLIRGVSILLVFLAVLTLAYGIYGYYVKTVATIGLEKTNSLALRTSEAEIENVEQHSVISEDGELIVVSPATVTADEHAADHNQVVPQDSAMQSKKIIPATAQAPAVAAVAPENTKVVASSPAGDGSDVIELQAYDESWVEIVDAADRKLYHNMVQNEQVLHLQGDAPFDVFLGNAPAIELKVNQLEVNINRYIRTNNVARFSVSTRDGNVVFR